MPADDMKFIKYLQHELRVPISLETLLPLTICPTCNTRPGLACFAKADPISQIVLIHGTRINRLLKATGMNQQCRKDRFYCFVKSEENCWREVCPTSVWDNRFDLYTKTGRLHGKPRRRRKGR
jgi:hypothetical protein